jgi:hypothetical protein
MSRYEHLRLQTSIRGAIIGYGIAAYALLVPASPVGALSPFPTFDGKAMLLIGLVLQGMVLTGRALARRYEDAHLLQHEVTPLVVFVLELVADGVTVLLFALATYAPLVQFAAE